ncbi:nitrile hydratase subunit beta [Stappia sp. F7233]|uniref:Nitrile hydratase subunit beta n=1 Tax=Stappia albiluteola TaxID=2758565 RepID=A0A839AEN9_9HYPH|nr:nitrile hydratase subunit beta [Stappia albiluteola]MBA5777362.1 nitrile hydratase subunit beta [Stappia albiluteola]
MNGAQDLGGMMGFGPVEPEKNEPVFHAEWEERAFALTVAMGGTGEWNIDSSRFARESAHPATYLASSYYQIWLGGLERLLEDRGLVTRDELDAGRSLHESRPVKRVITKDLVAPVFGQNGTYEREPAAPARFAVGDAVVTKVMHPAGHTRIPRYVRGRPGIIERIHGCHVLPDSNSLYQGEAPTWLYSVAFKGTDIWGADSDPGLMLRVDLWETYLDAR